MGFLLLIAALVIGPSRTGGNQPTLAPSREAPVELAVRGVTLIDGTGAPAQRDATVLMVDGRISAIAGSDWDGDAASILDADGLFLIPGLIDAHVHVLAESQFELLGLQLVAHGVLRVRDMSTALDADTVDALYGAVDDGAIVAPRFVAAGPLIDGPGRSAGALGTNVIAVHTTDEARAAVQTIKARGADFVKVYNRLDLELLTAIVDEAREVDLPVAGHCPHSVTVPQAATLGLVSLEHMNGILAAISTVGERLTRRTAEALTGTPTANDTRELLALRAEILETRDPELARSVYATLVDEGTWICPTLVSNRTLRGIEVPSERMRYVPRSMRDNWTLTPRTAEGPTLMRRRFERILETVGEMHEAGVRFVAGTDLGVPGVSAGSSLHDELELLVEAGMTPEEALLAATRNAAALLGILEREGSIEVGKRANFVLLRADPTVEIANVRLVEAVVLDGEVLDRGTLDGFLERAAEIAAE